MSSINPSLEQQAGKSNNLEVALIFSLLILTLGSVIYGLAYMVRDLPFGWMIVFALVALLLSWQFARNSLSGWFVGLWIVFIGILLTFTWAGDLGALLGNVMRAGSHWIIQTLLETGNNSITPLPVLASLLELQSRMKVIFSELATWFQALISGVPVYNYLTASFIWTLAIWLASAWAGWYQRRRMNAWIGVLPAGMLLAMALGYTYGSTRALILYLIASLILTAATAHFKRTRQWDEKRMDFPEDDHNENFVFISGMIVSLVIAALLISQFSIRGVIDRFRVWLNPDHAVADQVFESFGLGGDLAGLGSLAPALDGGLPRRHLIGSGPELADQIVMAVEIEENAAFDEIRDLDVPIYFRSVTYDRYTGDGWASSEVMLHPYRAGEIALDLDSEYYRLLRQFVQIESPDNTDVYAAGEIVSLDTDYRIAWRDFPGNTETLTAPGDFFAASQDERAYHVQSLLPVVSENDLRSAPSVYPPWVVERYLTVPRLSQRVIDLARRLTVNAPNAYDKIHALEQYLRGYKYELNLPDPPQNRDLVDYFLFELQKGYCDYYASALVVMARSVGVPARLAVGYSHGNYDADSHQYIVTARNAHSWVEVYFPGVGWVPFEPTAAQAEINRSAVLVDSSRAGDQPSESDARDSLWEGFPTQWISWLVGIPLGMVIFVGVWLSLDILVLRWLSPPKVMTHLYKRLYTHGAWLDSPAGVGETPYEFVESLKRQITLIKLQSRWQIAFSNVNSAIDQLTQNYVRSAYGPQPLTKAEIKSMLVLWRQLRRKLFLIRLLRLFQQLRIQAGRRLHARTAFLKRF